MNNLPFYDEVTLGELYGKFIHVNEPDSTILEAYYAQHQGTIYAPVRLPPQFGRSVGFDSKSQQTDGATKNPDSDNIYETVEPTWKIPSIIKNMMQMGKRVLASPADDLVELLATQCYHFMGNLANGGGLFNHQGRKSQNSTGKKRTIETPHATLLQGLSWHPYRQSIAVAAQDCVYIYHVNSQTWDDRRVLSNEDQKNVQDVAWAPCSSGLIAVACSTGVCIWTIYQRKNSFSFKRNKLSMRLLKTPLGRGADQVSWNPDGRLLAVSSKQDRSISIWDVAYESRTLLRRLGVGYEGSINVRWSPNGHYLFASSEPATFLVWETMGWTYEKWTSPSGPCIDCAWAPSSDCLLMGISNSTCLFPLLFNRKVPEIDAQLSSSTIDLSPVEVYTEDGSVKQEVGGSVKLLKWDASGERVAICFNESLSMDPSAGGLVAIFSVNRVPFLKLTPRGYIRGPPNGGEAVAMAFCPQFPRGGMLCVGWQNNLVSFYPMYF